MPDCRLCGAYFPNRIVVAGLRRNVSNRKYCLDCSPFGSHNVRTLETVLAEPALDGAASRTCARCGKTKPLEDFYVRPDTGSWHSWCKPCNNEHRRARFREDRLAALRRYSGGEPQCACCGERNVEFLALDHVADNGAAHRRFLGIGGGGQFYSWLRKTGYTYDGLAVACHNCNMARAMYGQCPHVRNGPVAHQD